MRARRQASLFVAALALLAACWAGEAKAQYGSVGTAAGYLPVGTTTIPASMLGVYGGVTIGNSYISTTAPSNGAIIQGSVGIGTTSPGQLLTVNGNATIGLVSNLNTQDSLQVFSYGTGGIVVGGAVGFNSSVSNTGYGGRFAADPAGNVTLSSIYDTATSALYFKMRTIGTPVTAMTILEAATSG